MDLLAIEASEKISHDCFVGCWREAASLQQYFSILTHDA